jgi:DNA-binding transcriptional regulator GbsR (MarR family)
MSRAPASGGAKGAVAVARRTLLEGVGQEVAASFPGITRLGGQIVAALYLADDPRSMDDLALELGRSKSNIFANLRGLEAAGIVARHRETGARFDSYALKGKYPDVVIGAYVARLRRVLADKRTLVHDAIDMLGDADGTEADALRERLDTLAHKYDRFGTLFNRVVPPIDGPVDLEAILDAIPEPVLLAATALLARALAPAPRARPAKRR